MDVWLLIKGSSLIFRVVESHGPLAYHTSTLKHTMADYSKVVQGEITITFELSVPTKILK